MKTISNMKKAFLFIALLATAVAANGQDTVYGDSVFENYFYRREVQINRSDFPLEIQRSDGGNYELIVNFNTDDTLIVYGVAAVIGNPKEIPFFSFEYFPCADTTEASANDTMKLFISSGDTFVPLRTFLINPFLSPTAYYLNLYGSPIDSYTYVERVVEHIFDTPAKVHGLFGIGKTYFDRSTVPVTRVDPDTGEEEIWHINAHLNPLGAYIRKNNGTAPPNDTVTFHFYHRNGPPELNPLWVNALFHPLLVYPIIIPPGSNPVGSDTIALSQDTLASTDDTIAFGDTIVVHDTVFICNTSIVCDTFIYEGDTIIVYDTIMITDTIVTCDTLLGIPSGGMLGHLTGISPNPAIGSTQILSSFGILRVEAFNTAGKRVFDFSLPGKRLSLTLDVSHWPQGAYLLRIHTPMGIAVKKLIKR